MSPEATDKEHLHSLVGQHLGYSRWLDITQCRVDRFAEATGDEQWIHIDPTKAAESRFGGTVVHGYLILSLTSYLLADILDLKESSLVVNYGCDRVRFLSPLPVGSRH